MLNFITMVNLKAWLVLVSFISASVISTLAERTQLFPGGSFEDVSIHVRLAVPANALKAFDFPRIMNVLAAYPAKKAAGEVFWLTNSGAAPQEDEGNMWWPLKNTIPTGSEGAYTGQNVQTDLLAVIDSMKAAEAKPNRFDKNDEILRLLIFFETDTLEKIKELGLSSSLERDNTYMIIVRKPGGHLPQFPVASLGSRVIVLSDGVNLPVAVGRGLEAFVARWKDWHSSSQGACSTATGRKARPLFRLLVDRYWPGKALEVMNSFMDTWDVPEYAVQSWKIREHKPIENRRLQGIQECEGALTMSEWFDDVTQVPLIPEQLILEIHCAVSLIEESLSRNWTWPENAFSEDDTLKAERRRLDPSSENEDSGSESKGVTTAVPLTTTTTSTETPNSPRTVVLFLSRRTSDELAASVQTYDDEFFLSNRFLDDADRNSNKRVDSARLSKPEKVFLAWEKIVRSWILIAGRQDANLLIIGDSPELAFVLQSMSYSSRVQFISTSAATGAAGNFALRNLATALRCHAADHSDSDEFEAFKRKSTVLSARIIVFASRTSPVDLKSRASYLAREALIGLEAEGYVKFEAAVFYPTVSGCAKTPVSWVVGNMREVAIDHTKVQEVTSEGLWDCVDTAAGYRSKLNQLGDEPEKRIMIVLAADHRYLFGKPWARDFNVRLQKYGSGDNYVLLLENSPQDSSSESLLDGAPDAVIRAGPDEVGEVAVAMSKFAKINMATTTRAPGEPQGTPAPIGSASGSFVDVLKFTVLSLTLIVFLFEV